MWITVVCGAGQVEDPELAKLANDILPQTAWGVHIFLSKGSPQEAYLQTIWWRHFAKQVGCLAAPSASMHHVCRALKLRRALSSLRPQSCVGMAVRDSMLDTMHGC